LKYFQEHFRVWLNINLSNCISRYNYTKCNNM
jgi:hypothetical protein